MNNKRTASQVLEEQFLEIRAALISLGAMLDRIDCAENADSVKTEVQYQKIEAALKILNERQKDRAAEILMLFSDPYDPDWQKAR